MVKRQLSVPDFPTIRVQLAPDGSATVDVAGRPTLYPPAPIDATRRAILTQATEVAITLGRAVRMDSEETGAAYTVAVHPDGTLTELGVATSRTRRPSADTTRPRTSSPPSSGPPTAAPPAVAPRQIPPPPAAPPQRVTLRLSFNTQDSIDVDQNAALGRNPAAIGGRLPVPVVSPARMVSRTHALVDVDDAGRIIVTDHHSGNGIETQTDPPVRLDPGVPYVIEPGTALVMGDVECTVELIER